MLALVSVVIVSKKKSSISYPPLNSQSLNKDWIVYLPALPDLASLTAALAKSLQSCNSSGSRFLWVYEPRKNPTENAAKPLAIQESKSTSASCVMSVS